MTRTRTLGSALLSLAALGLASAPPAAAQDPVLTPSGTYDYFSYKADGFGSTGYVFTTGSNATGYLVSSLGYFNNGGTLTASHDVGVFTYNGDYNSTPGTLLVSGTVQTTDSGSGVFTYTSVLSNALILAANTQYVVGGYVNNSDPFVIVAPNNYATSNGFTLNAAAYSDANGLSYAYPHNGGDTYYRAYLGGTLAVTPVAPAPEPSQAMALTFGVLGLAGLSLRARRRAAC